MGMNPCSGSGPIMRKALPYALRTTLPVLSGFIAGGFAFGLLYQQAGYGLLLTALTSGFVYAGASQFVAVELFLSGAPYLQIALVTFLVNCRHLLYGTPFVERFRPWGARKWYIVFGLTDETFALFSVAEIPGGVRESDYFLLIAGLNHIYWVLGCLLGNGVGQIVHLNFAGVDFAMNAMFIVIFLEQWKNQRIHAPALIGLGCTALALLLFGAGNMLIPAMLAILALLFAMQRPILAKEESICR